MYSYLKKINENTNSSISILLQTGVWACVHTLSDQDGEKKASLMLEFQV